MNNPTLKVVDDDISNDELDKITLAHDANGGIYNDPDLAAMNSKYAVVKVGGKTRVVSLEDSASYPGSKVPVFSTIPGLLRLPCQQEEGGHRPRWQREAHRNWQVVD
jgi:hypothetical protein